MAAMAVPLVNKPQAKARCRMNSLQTNAVATIPRLDWNRSEQAFINENKLRHHFHGVDFSYLF
tara:strand:- start:291 stop:479 length:189 start_codon:yes stop_codon:yes gene_type:complete